MDMEIVIDGVRDLMRRHDFATPTALAAIPALLILFFLGLTVVALFGALR